MHTLKNAQLNATVVAHNKHLIFLHKEHGLRLKTQPTKKRAQEESSWARFSSGIVNSAFDFVRIKAEQNGAGNENGGIRAGDDANEQNQGEIVDNAAAQEIEACHGDKGRA